jgi:hypothetical protein
MSRGLGKLQLDLRAKLQARPDMAMSARDLTAEVLQDRGLTAAAANKAWHSTNVAVRKALAGLEKAGHIALVNRRGAGGLRATNVVYTADLAILDDLRRRRSDFEAGAARLAAMGRLPPPSEGEGPIMTRARELQKVREERDRRKHEACLAAMQKSADAEVRAKPGEAAAGLGRLPEALLAGLEARPAEALTLTELAELGAPVKGESQKAIKSALSALEKAALVAQVRPTDGGLARYAYIARPLRE